MRSLTEVIEQLLSISKNQELNDQLETIKYSISFTAPENMHIRWNETHGALEATITEPVSDETVKLLSVFSTRSEEELREYFSTGH